MTHTQFFYNISHLAVHYLNNLLQISGIDLHHFQYVHISSKTTEAFSILSLLCFTLISESLN